MVSDVVAVSAITVIGGLVTLVVTRWLNRIDKKIGLVQGKQDETLVKQDESISKQEEVHKQINSRMDELLESAKEAARLKGEKAGKAAKKK